MNWFKKETAKKVVLLPKNVKIPKNLRRPIKVSELEIGCHAYASYNTVVEDANGFLWLDDVYDLSVKPCSYRNIKITRLEDGFEVDISNCLDDKWTMRRGSAYEREHVVVSLKGVEEREINIKKEEEKNKRKEREFKLLEEKRTLLIQRLIDEGKITETEKELINS